MLKSHCRSFDGAAYVVLGHTRVSEKNCSLAIKRKKNIGANFRKIVILNN